MPVKSLADNNGSAYGAKYVPNSMEDKGLI